jgi:hypothetical protein
MLKRARTQFARNRTLNLENSGLGLQRSASQPPRQADWAALIPDREWQIYRRAIRAVRSTGAPFMLGGGFGLASYIDRWRDTKDIDFYVLPKTRQTLIKALSDAGFEDYYSKRPYDRGWIYRSIKQGVIVDIIWSMANRRAQVEPSWFEYAKTIGIREESLQVVSAEELLWCKLYVFQRDHCDWLDVINLLYATASSLDWRRLMARLGNDLQFLKSALILFDWLCSNRSGQLAPEVRRRFQLPAPTRVSRREMQRRVRLLDSRAWFAAFLSPDVRLEI